MKAYMLGLYGDDDDAGNEILLFVIMKVVFIKI